MLRCDAVKVAFAEDGMLLSAVGAGVGAHVLDDAEEGDIHHFGHFYRFFDDHADELLRGGDDDDAIHREGLEYGEGDIAGAGGHIDEHEVHVLPVDIGPELADRPGNDRAAPDDGIAFLLQQQVDGHDLGTEAGDGGQHDLAEAFGLFPDAERLRDTGAGDIGIEDGGAVA